MDIIPNEFGSPTTPSVVAFTGEEVRIGEAAKEQAVTNPTRTIYDVNRIIGRKYSDTAVQEAKKDLSYEIVDRDGNPYIKVDVKGETKFFSP
jgi:heat shock protein 5